MKGYPDYTQKVFLTMKLISFFVLVASMQVSAGAYSQKLTLSRQGAELEEVFEEVYNQSGYLFLYTSTLMKDARPVTINVRNAPLEKVLELCFRDQPFTYSIVEKTVVVKPLAQRTQKNSRNLPVPPQQAQPIAVTGQVTDEETGETLPGVSVTLKGTHTGTSTELDGTYRLVIPESGEGQVLVFSLLGYTSREVALGEQRTVSVKLAKDISGLDEVVVVGYGTQKKVNLTGAVDVISNEQLSNRQSATVSQLLQGLSPGMNLDISGQNGFQPGASMDISVRGIGSLNGGSPYILIDGLPGSIDNLNPDDIESISVLKDAAASAIYGARAPYGVILVTTKNGSRNEKMSISYSGNVMVNTPQRLPESLDSYTWVRIQNEAGDNSGGHPFSDATVDRVIAFQNQDWDYLRESIPDLPAEAAITGAYPDGNIWNQANLNFANTDWWDIYYGSSVNQKHDLSLKGGSKNASYYFSVGYYTQEGVLNYGVDNFQRLNLMGKVNVSIADWWDFSWEPRLSKKSREMPNMTKEGDYSFMYRHISRNYPITPLYDGWGNYMSESHIPSITEGGTDEIDDIDAWNNFRMEIRPLRGWKINADLAYNFNTGTRSDVEKTVYVHNVDNSLSPFGVTVPSNIERLQHDNRYWTTNVYTSYDLSLNDAHNFYILAGMQYEKGRDNLLRGYKTDLISNEVPSLETATGTSILSEDLSHRATMGYFSRLTYNYKEKYLLETNVRYDGSYVFREGNRWGFFPSFSAGWNIHNEPFWEPLGAYVNAFKIRASWGQLGNQQASPYSDLELIPLQTGSLNWIFNYGERRPIGYTTAPGIVNRNLTWETSTTKNLGLNLAFLDNRLEADLDVFERLTTDMIGPSEAKPGVLGASVPRDNNAALRTRGWELSLRWQQAFQSGISYFVNANLFDYTSVVTEYFNPTGTLSTWYEGRKVGDIWGYTVNDLFRTQEELDRYLASTDLSYLASNWRTGDLRYEDITQDGKVNNGSNTVDDPGDMTIIGNDNPRYQYGITAGLSYKGFDFSMLWRGVAKKDIYFYRMANIFWGFTNGWWESTLTPDHLDYFRDKSGTRYSGLYEGEANINTDAYWPRPYLNSTEEAKNKNHANTRYLQDASYIRLQHVQLGYSFPQTITSRLKLQQLRVFFSGENLLTFSKLPDGIDPVAPVGFPEGGSGNYYGTAGSGRLTYGADRIYSFGLTVTY